MEKKHRCSICDKQFSSLRSLRNHAGSEYPNTVQPQRCGCGKSFCSKNALKMHQSARGSTCVFKCSGCAKKFNSESALKNHLASPAHSRPPPQTNAPSPTSSPNATTGDQGSVGYISLPTASESYDINYVAGGHTTPGLNAVTTPAAGVSTGLGQQRKPKKGTRRPKKQNASSRLKPVSAAGWTIGRPPSYSYLELFDEDQDWALCDKDCGWCGRCADEYGI